MREPIAIAILAKAPIAGLAKTRLIPTLGADGAAGLQAQFIRRTVTTALAARIGPVTLWCTPTTAHPLFAELAADLPVALMTQPESDLGHRMVTAIAAQAPAIVIGTDCPAFTPDDLRGAADALRAGADVTLTPAEDGGYVLIGMKQADARVFANMKWGRADVLAETRARIAAAGLACHENPMLWDVDEPADLERLHGPALLGST